MVDWDPKTMERLANVIVDPEGPYERRGRELADLLERASWPDPPLYDGSPRIPWLIDLLERRRDDPAAMERLICRVCDPLEYEDGRVTAEEFRLAINAKIEAEGVAITYVNGRPVLGEVNAEGHPLVRSAPQDLENRLRELIRDRDTVQVLLRRSTEAQICAQGGAHTLAIIGIGSLVEGLLYALLVERDEDASNHRFLGRNGQLVTEKRPGLAMLIDTVHHKGWIQFDAMRFMEPVRDFRNFVHPRKELAEQPDFDADSVGLCWGPLHAVLNDLEQRFR